MLRLELLNFWDILLLLGILQGIILSSIVFISKSHNPLTNKLVGVILAALTLAITGTFLDKFTFGEEQPFLRNLQIFFPFFIPTVIGPSIYVLVKSHRLPDYRFSKRDYYHFIPILFDITPTLLKITFVITSKIGISFVAASTLGSFLNTYNKYGDIFLWVQLSFYLFLSFKLLKKVAKKNQPNKVQQIKEKWLTSFTYKFMGFQLLWLPFLLIYVSDYDYLIWDLGIAYYYIYIPLIVLLYWIGLKWVLISREIKILSQFTINQPKASFHISKSSLQHYTRELKKLMNEKTLYTTPSLSVKDVSFALNIQPKMLSHILNNHLDSNFNDYINNYRIDYIKERLIDPNYNHLTIAAIAFESGFTSIATFQRAFKNREHISPRVYKQHFLSAMST